MAVDLHTGKTDWNSWLNVSNMVIASKVATSLTMLFYDKYPSYVKASQGVLRLGNAIVAAKRAESFGILMETTSFAALFMPGCQNYSMLFDLINLVDRRIVNLSPVLGKIQARIHALFYGSGWTMEVFLGKRLDPQIPANARIILGLTEPEAQDSSAVIEKGRKIVKELKERLPGLLPHFATQTQTLITDVQTAVGVLTNKRSDQNDAK